MSERKPYWYDKKHISKSLRARLMEVKAAETAVLNQLGRDFPLGSLVMVELPRAGATYFITGKVASYAVSDGRAELHIVNEKSGKKRALDIRCYRMMRL